jgi:hypothetical protein
MRMLVAILGAMVGAGLAVALVATPLASAALGRWLFSDPDFAARVHAWLFLGAGCIGLIAGWALGRKLTAPRQVEG